MLSHLSVLICCVLQNPLRNEIQEALNELEQRYHSPEPVLVEYVFEGAQSSVEDRTPKTLMIAVDRKARKACSRLTLVDSKGVEAVIHQFINGPTFSIWSSDGDAGSWDMRPFWAEVDRTVKETWMKLSAVLPKPPAAPVELDVQHPLILISALRKPNAETPGSFRLALGFSELRKAASWFVEIPREQGVLLRKEGAAYAFNLQASKRRFVIDGKSGWLTLLQVDDFDGERSLRATRLVSPSPFPVLEVPKAFKDLLPPEEQFRTSLYARVEGVFDLVREISLQWEDIHRQKREEVIPELLSRTVASLADQVDHHLSKTFADLKIRTWMNAGLSWADLQGDVDGYARSYARECLESMNDEDRDRGKVAQEAHRRILERTARAAEEQMKPFRQMIEQATQLEAVEKYRRDPSPEEFRKWFREALDRARKL